MPENNELINKKMLVDEVVHKLRYFTRLYGIDSLFIVGGYCRSLYLNRPLDILDIDIASAYPEQAMHLAGLFATEVLKSMPHFYKKTSTAMVQYASEAGEIRIEFQGKSSKSYMQNQEIRDFLHNNGIEDIALMHNIYGRDFTMNALIYSIMRDDIYDVTNRATQDLDDGKIISILPAKLLIKYNPMASLRAIRFALQYDFTIDNDLAVHMKDSYGLLVDSITQDRIVKEIVRILKINGSEGLDLLRRYNLDRIILDPRVKEFIYAETSTVDS